MAVSMTKTVLVTGATGFIGSSLIKALAESSLYNAIPCGRKGSCLDTILFGSKVQHWDILEDDEPDCHYPVDVIFHCATANNVLSADFKSGVDLTVYGTERVLSYAVKNNVTEVFFLSTVQVYGTELSGIISEETPSCCETGYALNHFYGEELCRFYNRKYGLKVTIIRPTNVYGVPLCSGSKRDTLVPACFVNEAITYGHIILKTPGLQYRNFISTSEIAYNMLQLLDSTGCNSDSRIVNISSNLYYSIYDVAQLVANKYKDLFGREIPVCVTTHGKMSSKIPFSVSGNVSITRNPREVSAGIFEQTIEKLLTGEGHE